MGLIPNNAFTKHTRHVNDSLTVIHQNRGLSNKSDELICSLTSNNNPHLICLSEHYLTSQNLSIINLDNYILGTSYAHTNSRGGGVCVCIRSNINFTTVDVSQFCEEMNIEICATKITVCKTNIIVLCTYRSPNGNFDHFVNTLDRVLKIIV
jgi:hypothetical protein